MAEACRALEFPVVSGNVSLYNETNGVAILPTPAIGGVGLIENCERIARVDALQHGDALMLVGETRGHLGQSIYLREVHNREEGAPPPVDLAIEKKNADFVRGLIADGLIAACHDLSDGGLAIAAAEMALSSNVGAALSNPYDLEAGAYLFGEDQARYLLGVAQASQGEVSLRAKAAGVELRVVGEAGGANVSFVAKGGAGHESIALSDLRALHEGWLPSYMKVAH